jgi:hypothetical protein
MDNKRLEDKLDKLVEDVSEIKQIMAVNTKELEIHIEGVKLAREQNTLLKEEMDSRFNALDSDIKPIKRHVDFVKGAMWAIGICGAALVFLNEIGVLSKLF